MEVVSGEMTSSRDGDTDSTGTLDEPVIVTIVCIIMLLYAFYVFVSLRKEI